MHKMSNDKKNRGASATRPKSAYELHRFKVKKALPAIDMNPPKERPHVLHNAKRQQLERERLARIEKDNFILWKKLNDIMHRKQAKEGSHRLVFKESTCLRTR